MKTSLLTTLALATLVAVSARAQLQTYDTRPNYTGSVFTFDANGSLGQTFTNVSAVKSMTYDFFSGSGGNVVDTQLTAVFGQWNGSSFVGGTTVSFGTITIPAANSGQWASTLANGPANNTYANFAYQFDLSTLSSNLIDPTYGYLTNPNNTYALMLTNTGAADELALGLTNSNAFIYGAADGFGTKDWTFAQLVVAPGNQNLTAAPEPATVAAICGALLVGGLIVLRVRQRHLAPVPAA